MTIADADAYLWHHRGPETQRPCRAERQSLGGKFKSDGDLDQLFVGEVSNLYTLFDQRHSTVLIRHFCSHTQRNSEIHEYELVRSSIKAANEGEEKVVLFFLL